MSKNRPTLSLPGKADAKPNTGAVTMPPTMAPVDNYAAMPGERPVYPPPRPPVEIKRLHPGAVVPAYQTAGAAAFDFVAVTSHNIAPGTAAEVRTGVAIWLRDPGLGLFIYARGGLGSKKGVRPGNCVGVVDSDYQGEVIVTLRNDSDVTFTVRAGDRIAQGVVAPVLQVPFVEVREFSDATARGEGRFGSTGLA